MNGMITFDPAVPLWMVIPSFVVISIFLIWKEWGRSLRFRTWRIVAAIVMMVMLSAILLRPHTNFLKSTSILLLTPGYNPDQVDSVISLYKSLRIIHTPGTLPYNKSRPLNSYHELHNLGGDVKFVIGQGLRVHALDLLDNKEFTFIPGKLPDGIVEMSVADSPKINRLTTITGIFRNSSGVHSIALVGPGGKEDSVTITKNGETPFTLSFIPRQQGNLLYSLSITDGIGKSRDERFPVTVEQPSRLKVLVVLSYPKFETTFLKNFIASKGNELVLRSRLSRNNFSYEYINHETIKFSTLTKKVLDEFDLLIIDRQALQGLSNQESSTLKQSIRNGLGLLSLYDVAPKEKDQNNFFPFRTIAAKGDTTTIESGSRRFTLPALPFRVISDVPLQPVFTNDSGILSGYTLVGAGKIGFQLIQETYRLVLAGDTLLYGKLWSPLLEHVARTYAEPATISTARPFPYYTDEPIPLRLTSSDESPVLFADSVKIPLREDVQLDGVWHAKIWASTPGWHRLQTDGKDLAYFVSESDDWHSLALENQMKDNRMASRTEKETPKTSAEKRKINPLVFYGAFLLAAGFLWLAPKL